MNLVKVDDILEKSHDVILEGGTKHRCFDTTRLFEISTVDAPVWTPVEDGLPVLTDDEDNEFLVTIKMSRSTRKPMYYVIIASYSENLLSLDEFDFPGEDRPGWYGYDPEEGFFDIEHNIGDYKREVVAWMPMPKPYKKGEAK